MLYIAALLAPHSSNRNPDGDIFPPQNQPCLPHCELRGRHQLLTPLDFVISSFTSTLLRRCWHHTRQSRPRSSSWPRAGCWSSRTAPVQQAEASLQDCFRWGQQHSVTGPTWDTQQEPSRASLSWKHQKAAASFNSQSLLPSPLHRREAFGHTARERARRPLGVTGTPGPSRWQRVPLQRCRLPSHSAGLSCTEVSRGGATCQKSHNPSTRRS